MSMQDYTIAMVGYDISHLSGYIRELEEADDDKWIDGIPEYSLNCTDNEIGYEHVTRKMFGKVLFETDDADSSEEGEMTQIPFEDMEQLRKKIWERYKMFLFDHTKIADKTEPPFVLSFITYYA